MPRLTALVVAAFMLAARGVAAQAPPVDLSSFYHALATGVGARAWAMGGTGIALADALEDTTWNPAASGDLRRPVAHVVFAGDRLTGDVDAIRYGLSNGPNGTISPGETSASGSRIHALQFAFPFAVAGRRLVAGAAYRRRLSLPDRTDAAYLYHLQSLYRFDYDYRFHADGQGGFDTFDLSVGSEIAKGVRAGVTVHRWFGSVSSSYSESYRYAVSNYYGWDGGWNERFGDELRIEMSGFSVDVGVQVAARDKYFAGAVFRSGTGAGATYSNAATYEDDLAPRTAAAAYSGRGSLDLPGSFGAGFAVRPVRGLTLAVDQSWAFWSGAALDNYARVTALGGVPQPSRVSFPAGTPPDLHAQSNPGRTSFGAEYKVSAGAVRIPLRAGAAYQQAYDVVAGRGSQALTAGAGVEWRGLSLDTAWVRDMASGRYTRQSLTGGIGWTF
jgi:hypothetical protein